MQVVILCGGKGTRAHPLTEQLPKPMLPIGGVPMLLHLMQLFADQGHADFVLSIGHRGEAIRDFVRTLTGGWRVEVVDTGVEADTGDRVLGCRTRLADRFFVTYGDGLANVPLDALAGFHDRHAGLATMTTVPLTSPFGAVEMDAAGQVSCFREKPVLKDHWINAGFFVMDSAVFDHWPGANLERDILPGLSRKGLLYAFRHDGFFKAVDSYKDQQEYDALLAAGRAPWREMSRPSPEPLPPRLRHFDEGADLVVLTGDDT